MVSISYVKEEDMSFWFKLDKHLSEAEFEKKIRDKMGYVLLDKNVRIGLLRYNLFWDNTPFCTSIFVDFGGKVMKKISRIVLFIFAIIIGGLLGDKLLVGFELSKMCFFGVACAGLGFVINTIDKKIMR